MKPEKLRALKSDELDARAKELENELFNARIKHATGQLENTARLRTTRRDLARALTVLAERRRAE